MIPDHHRSCVPDESARAPQVPPQSAFPLGLAGAPLGIPALAGLSALAQMPPVNHLEHAAQMPPVHGVENNAFAAI